MNQAPKRPASARRVGRAGRHGGGRRARPASMDRNNETWLADLQADGAIQHAALAELRATLLRGLRSALAYRVPFDDSQWEDVVQLALLRILDRLSQFNGRSRFITWALAVAIRVAMTESRRRHWRDISLDELLVDGSPTVPTREQHDTPARHAERDDFFATLYDLIESVLTVKQRTALMAELKGMPQDEIARQLNSNRNAVYKLTHDARKRLKQALQAAGYDQSDIQRTLAR